FGNQSRSWREPKWAAAMLALLGCVLVTGRAAAQSSMAGLVIPRLMVVSPCGAKAGSTVEVTASGFGLDEPASLALSGARLKAESLPPPPQPGPQRLKGKQKRQVPPLGPLSRVKFKVAIPAGIPLGIHDVRVVTKGGISNPRAFVIGDLPEVREKEPNND